MNMISVLLLVLTACKFNMRELNAIRIRNEELEHLIRFASFADDADRNRSEYLINENVEALWHCTLH